MRSLKTEQKIRFLEDDSNQDDPLLPSLFPSSDIEGIALLGRKGYAQLLRGSLIGGVGG